MATSNATTETRGPIYSLHLTGFPADRKVPVIKSVREITGLDLKKAKDLVESVPALLKGFEDEKGANAAYNALRAIGAECILEAPDAVEAPLPSWLLGYLGFVRHKARLLEEMLHAAVLAAPGVDQGALAEIGQSMANDIKESLDENTLLKRVAEIAQSIADCPEERRRYEHWVDIYDNPRRPETFGKSPV